MSPLEETRHCLRRWAPETPDHYIRLHDTAASMSRTSQSDGTYALQQAVYLTQALAALGWVAEARFSDATPLLDEPGTFAIPVNVTATPEHATEISPPVRVWVRSGALFPENLAVIRMELAATAACR